MLREVPHAPLDGGANGLEAAAQHAEADGGELRLVEGGLLVRDDVGLDAGLVGALLDFRLEVRVEPVQVGVAAVPHLARQGARRVDRVEPQQRDVVLQVACGAAEAVEFLLDSDDLAEHGVLDGRDADPPVDGHREAQGQPLDEGQRVDGLLACLPVHKKVAYEGPGLDVEVGHVACDGGPVDSDCHALLAALQGIIVWRRADGQACGARSHLRRTN